MIRRRDIVRALGAVGTASLLVWRQEWAAAEPPPETSTLRLVYGPSMCQAPLNVAETLLRGEGFVDVEYIKKPGVRGIEQALASGEANIAMHFVAPVVLRLEAGDPIVILAGAHVGCFELFGNARVQAIHDLKRKTVAVLELGTGQHVFLASMVSYVGLDPGKDVNWVVLPPAVAKQRLAEDRIDAYLGFPPDPQELRAKKIGHVVVDSAVDRPWSQYFCCMVVANREFVRRRPVATKRALRAILKAIDLCAAEPANLAKALVQRWYPTQYDYALQVLRHLPYGRWREYDPEDSVRFYALRLREAGMISSSPQKVIAQGTDWRFLNDLKKELKA